MDIFFAWQFDTDYLQYASDRKNPSVRDPGFYAPYPPAVNFWYRQSPHYPISSDIAIEQFSFNRDNLEPGAQAVVLDSEGKLLEFQARPSARAPADNRPGPDWYRLFAAAGLDSAAFKTVQPELTPGAAFDARGAWIGSSQGDQNLRVEAAAYQGRPVSFRVLAPWTRFSGPQPVSFGGLSTPMFALGVLALPTAAGLLAWRNMRTGRSDRRGAFRLTVALFLFSLLGNLATVHHVPTAAEFWLLFAAARFALALAGLGWVLYMAFEPQLRGRTPESLISWNRLLAGRPRDPMVGGHLLAGVALGVLVTCLTNAFAPLPFLTNFAPKLPWSGGLLLSLWCSDLITGVAGGLSFALILNWICILVRSRWLGAMLFVLAMTLVLAPGYGPPSFETLFRSALAMLILAIAFARFGVLATVAHGYTRFILQDFPLTTNWSAWYANAALVALITLIGLALFGFVTTLKRPPMVTSF